MVDHEPPDDRTAAPERVDLALRGVCPAGEVEVDVHHRARAGAASEPCVEVDEDRTGKDAAFEYGVAGYVRIADVELDDGRHAGAADEGVDDEPTIERRLDARRGGRVERGTVDDRKVQGDGLELSSHKG